MLGKVLDATQKEDSPTVKPKVAKCVPGDVFVLTPGRGKELPGRHSTLRSRATDASTLPGWTHHTNLNGNQQNFPCNTIDRNRF
jgi:hypothetical protein